MEPFSNGHLQTLGVSVHHNIRVKNPPDSMIGWIQISPTNPDGPYYSDQPTYPGGHVSIGVSDVTKAHQPIEVAAHYDDRIAAALQALKDAGAAQARKTTGWNIDFNYANPEQLQGYLDVLNTGLKVSDLLQSQGMKQGLDKKPTAEERVPPFNSWATGGKQGRRIPNSALDKPPER